MSKLGNHKAQVFNILEDWRRPFGNPKPILDGGEWTGTLKSNQDIVRFEMVSENDDTSSSWEIEYKSRNVERYEEHCTRLKKTFEAKLGGRLDCEAFVDRNAGNKPEYVYMFEVDIY